MKRGVALQEQPRLIRMRIRGLYSHPHTIKHVHVSFRYVRIISCLLICILLSTVPKTVNRVGALDESPVTVGATYYGGEFDEGKNAWIIDNADQCGRIAAGEFSAESLAAIVSNTCSDDSGLGYMDDIPLHNRVAYAELSNPPDYSDNTALGDLAAGTRLEINYHGRCVIAEKLDVGTGGYGVGAYPRAIDLWWQTARTLGFANGFDTVVIKRVSNSTPLSPVGKTSDCTATTQPAPATAPKSKTGTNTQKPASQNGSQDAPQTEAKETPTGTSSESYVKLPKTNASYGPRQAKDAAWVTEAILATIALFAVTEVVLAVLIFKRRTRHVKIKRPKQ